MYKEEHGLACWIKPTNRDCLIILASAHSIMFSHRLYLNSYNLRVAMNTEASSSSLAHEVNPRVRGLFLKNLGDFQTELARIR